MADVDDLLRQLADSLDELVEHGELELVTAHGAAVLASELFARLEVEPELDLEDWFVDRAEVKELYLDGDELRARLRPVLARMASSDPAPRLNPEMLAAIAAKPDDLQARLVYADWLTQAGDPRGELITLQIRRGERPDDVDLARREEALLAHYHTFFFGAIQPWAVEVTLRYGFFDRAVVFAAEGLRDLLALESSRLLREVYIPLTGAQLDDVDATLADRPLPPTLVALQLGAGRGRDGKLDLGRATRGLDRLERLAVSARQIVLDGISLPALWYLSIREIPADALEKLPKVRALDLTGGARLPEAEARRLAPTVRLVQGDPPIEGALAGQPVVGGAAQDSDDEDDSDNGEDDERYEDSGE